MQIARTLGLTVFGTAGTEEGRELVRREGAHHVFDHGAGNYLQDAVLMTSDSKGFDIILEMLANINLGKDLPALARFGRVVVIGSRGPVEINPRDTMGRDASILGMILFNATPEERHEINAALYEGLANGTLRPIVDKEMPLAEAANAHVEIMKSSGHHGKIVLIP